MNAVEFASPSALVAVPSEQRIATVRRHELLCAAFAASLIPLGLIWDFSWESTIGVDRFWSPPHLAINLGVWLSGLLGLWLVGSFTRATQRGAPAAGINLGPFCAPSGAWLLVWSALVFQTGLLFDGWWQRAYGLGAGIWHPPQILKATGFFGVLFGSLTLCARAQWEEDAPPQPLTWLTAWLGSLLVAMCALVLTMTNYPNLQHTGSFYLFSCALYPAVLTAAGWAAPGRWGATRVALGYMALVCAMIWLLPLFPARPLMPPIHNHLDHLMPPAFPLLLVVPALALDALRQRFLGRPLGPFSPVPLRFSSISSSDLVRNSESGIRISISLGLCFFALFLPVQWFFARLLLSPRANNWFFAGGGCHWPFFLKIDQARTMFWSTQEDPLTLRTALLALLLAVSSSWLGTRLARGLTRLRR